MIAGPRIRTLERYFARQIFGGVGFVLLGFLALFAFFDLIKELGDLDRGEYHLRAVFLFVLLSLPAHAYELFPIAVLIGTLYVLGQLAANSEYTVMRTSGLSPLRAGLMLGKIGLAFVLVTFVLGEWAAPYAEETAQKVKLRAMRSTRRASSRPCAPGRAASAEATGFFGFNTRFFQGNTISCAST